MKPALYQIASGTEVSVCSSLRERGPHNPWRSHVTRVDLTLSEYRTQDTHGSSGAIIFAKGDWLILTRKDRVRQLAT